MKALNMPNLSDFCYIRRGKCVMPADAGATLALAAINQHSAGRSRALLLLHGFASSPAVFRNLHGLFHLYDAVVAPLLPGHGTSIADFSTVTAAAWIRAAEDSCAQLVRHYTHVDVLGLSLGGLLANHLSQIFNLHHLWLFAPAFHLKFNLPLAIAGANILNLCGVHSLMARGGDIMRSGSAELTYRRIPVPVILEILKLIRATSFVAPECPTDLFLGRHDRVVDSSAVADLYSGTENVKLHWLEHSAHVLPLDYDVKSIIRTIERSKLTP